MLLVPSGGLHQNYPGDFMHLWFYQSVLAVLTFSATSIHAKDS